MKVALSWVPKPDNRPGRNVKASLVVELDTLHLGDAEIHRQRALQRPVDSKPGITSTMVVRATSVGDVLVEGRRRHDAAAGDVIFERGVELVGARRVAGRHCRPDAVPQRAVDCKPRRRSCSLARDITLDAARRSTRSRATENLMFALRQQVRIMVGVVLAAPSRRRRHRPWCRPRSRSGPRAGRDCRESPCPAIRRRYWRGHRSPWSSR